MWLVWGFFCITSKCNGLFFTVISGVFVPYHFMLIEQHQVCLADNERKEENQTKTKNKVRRKANIGNIFPKCPLKMSTS